MTNNTNLKKPSGLTADKLRSNMDAAEYKHVVLGLIFLKYISDAFNSLYQKLVENKGEYEGADPKTRMSTWQTMSSSCPRPPAGSICRTVPNSPRSANILMTPWMP